MKIIKFTLTTLSLALLLFSSSCKKGGDPVANKAPENFTVSVSNVTEKTASLSWTAAKDPENAVVSYAIEMNSVQIISSLSATNYNLTGLTSNTLYSGKVTASDPEGNKTVSTFSFSTSDTPTPTDFTVTVDKTTNKSVSVSWTVSTLPGGVAVVYDVYLNGILLSPNLSVTKFDFLTLIPNTDYQIKIVAKSPLGKSVEKTSAAKTKVNTAPAAFTIQEAAHGYSFISITSTVAVDSDNDTISYYLIKDGVETLIAGLNPVSSFNQIIKNLDGNKSYAIALKAKDPFGGEVISNTLNILTNVAPDNNFIVQGIPNGSDVSIEWTTSYMGHFDPSNSYFYINGVAISLASVQVNFLPLSSSSMYIRIFIPNTYFPQNTKTTVKLKLNYGVNETDMQSTTLNHTRYLYAATTAQSNTAVIKKYSNGDLGTVITFQSNIISSYSTWTVEEIKLDNAISTGTITIQSPAGNTCQSVSGSLTQAEYDYLKTRSTGFVIVKDADGYHRINFTYTVL